MASPGNKRLVRSTKDQIKYLCEYMHAHPEFAAGEFKTPMGVAQSEKQWCQLKAALDELGPQRSVEQWKVCWRDQKRKARSEGGALNKAKNATGNSGDIPELSLNSVIILDTIGEEMAVGCGPEESPIGISGHTPQSHTVPAALPTQTPLPPSAPPAQKSSRRRVRKSHPPEKFINAQLELNSLMKELIKEVRRSNVLKEQNNRLLRRNYRH